jgi:hypothetical protein
MMAVVGDEVIACCTAVHGLQPPPAGRQERGVCMQQPPAGRQERGVCMQQAHVFTLCLRVAPTTAEGRSSGLAWSS